MAKEMRHPAALPELLSADAFHNAVVEARGEQLARLWKEALEAADYAMRKKIIKEPIDSIVIGFVFEVHRDMEDRMLEHLRSLGYLVESDRALDDPDNMRAIRASAARPGTPP